MRNRLLVLSDCSNSSVFVLYHFGRQINRECIDRLKQHAVGLLLLFNGNETQSIQQAESGRNQLACMHMQPIMPDMVSA